MNCDYRRKRIPGLPDESIRALDDEFAALERVAECVRETISGLSTNLSVINVTSSTLTIASDTGADAVVPAATTTTAGVVSYGSGPGTACQGNDSRLATNLGVSLITADGLSITSSTGNSALLPAGTPSAAGLITAAQVTALNSTVPNTRAINTAEGLQGGGNLSLNRTIKPVYGNTINTVCMGNDARLSDARTPIAHNHTEANITDLDRMRFRSYWNATVTYVKNDVVIDGPYIAVAKATTTDKPAPVFTQAEPAWLLTDAGTGWQELTGRRFFGHRYGPLIGDTLAQGVRFKTLSAGLIQYAYLMVNGTGRFDVAKNLITPANMWVEVRFPPVVLRTNDVIDLVCYVDDTHKYAWGPNSWPSGGTVKSFETWDQTYPPTTFALIQFGADVMIQSGTQSANWAVVCKSAV